jgi:quinohemoprotein ethanol dehydrogenase
LNTRGARGYVTAYDANTGAQRWRWWTVPGNPADGFENAAMEAAAKTWNGEWWKQGGGGTVWNAMTYDPELNRVYLGTGNGSPWNQKLRSPGGGDNLFLCSVVALDATTGEYVWHYQTTPGETWDFNSSMDMVLAEIEVDGAPRKVILHAPKNGFFYVLDRASGKLISAEKIGKVTWAEKVDLATGRPVEVPGVRYINGPALMWPGPGGVHNWHPMSYSPDTGLTYIPAREMAGLYDDRGITPANFDPLKHGPLGLRAFLDDIPKEAGSTSLLAWNPVTQKEVWRMPTPGATAGGVLSTRGGLVFQGLADGRFTARDANTGAELWSQSMGVGTQAPPITYELDGKQYVAVLAGWSGAPALMGSLSAQHGWVGREHPRRLLVYALDANTPLPASPGTKPAPKPTDDPSFVVDAAKSEKGQYLYANSCTICHGVAAVAGGYAPDLRASPVPLSADAFKTIVQGGALMSRGMPPFEEYSDADLENLRHYLRERARYEPSTLDQLKQAWNFIVLLVKMQLLKWGWID